MREETSFEFKALPVPKGVYEPMIPKAAGRAPTMPAPFNFKTEQRMSIARDSSTESVNKPFVFKALPIPKAVVEMQQPVKVVARALTEPQVGGCVCVCACVRVCVCARARVCVHIFDSPPQPFNLNSLSLAEQARNRFKIAVDAELAQEAAKFSSFKAAPVRISGSPFRPERSKLPLTEVCV